jgi:hypothetical protein
MVPFNLILSFAVYAYCRLEFQSLSGPRLTAALNLRILHDSFGSNWLLCTYAYCRFEKFDGELRIWTSGSGSPYMSLLLSCGLARKCQPGVLPSWHAILVKLTAHHLGNDKWFTALLRVYRIVVRSKPVFAPLRAGHDSAGRCILKASLIGITTLL